jgi:diguanylate cyclase (GGDEF)-like protein
MNRRQDARLGLSGRLLAVLGIGLLLWLLLLAAAWQMHRGDSEAVAGIAAVAPGIGLQAEAAAALVPGRASGSRLFGGLFAASLLLLAGLSLLLWRGWLQPIRELARAARRVEAGDYRLDLPIDRGDEIGELQRALTRLAAAAGQHQAEIRRIAYSDSLTGLPNRLALRETLERRMLQAQHGAWQVALVFVDLDDFKRINDTLGHDAGDEVLEQFAIRLQQCVALADDREASVARFGGDEFVALFCARDARDAARQLGEAVLVELQRPISVRGRQVFLGASIGITVYPDDAPDPHQLIKSGDIAMYQAKIAGKNCVRFFNRAMNQAVEHSVALEHALRGAWERGELSLSFQPIYSLSNRRMVGAEALLRWNHPELGNIEPAAFVEIAEQSGLIDGIGQRVLLSACLAAADWPDDHGLAPFVSVNVSPRQLRSGELPDIIAAVLRDSGLAAQRLHIELTETAVLGDELQVSALLARLRAMGVKIWLDDFGTGFSGLSHLRRVPVDGLKIDRSFISDMLLDRDDLALTSAIIALGHSLGITVVAEGVESEAQFSLLRERGCDYAQGFWLGHPVPDAEFRARAVA